VLDWGIGGFGFVRALRALSDGEDVPVVYLSDAGAPPYGRLSRPALEARVALAVARLHARGATQVVIACNAASTVIARLAASDRLPAVFVQGIVDAGVWQALAAAARVARRHGRRARIGVIGGVRTIRHGAHARALRRFGVDVVARVAQPLSARVEAGDLGSAALHAEIARIVAPLRGCDAVLLACTHYPALSSALARHLPGVALLDPAVALARDVAPLLVSPAQARGVPAPSPPLPPLRVLTTGDPRATARAAHAVFGVETGRVERIPLQ
jgi:glutamate racemase